MRRYDEFLTEVIDRGIAGLTEHYPPEKDGAYSHHKDNREGGIAGFEACRNKQPSEISAILADANDKVRAAHDAENKDLYWWYRYFALEVEWVCNVVSAALANQGEQVIVIPTARGVMQAATILGISDDSK